MWKMKLLLTLLALFVVVTAQQQTTNTDASDPCQERRTCPPNEAFVCCGTCTEPTCTKPQPINNCVNVCVAGCFCKPNYIRRTVGGPCVLADSCPKPKPKVSNKKTG
uniref:TIL domain-containing protein n=1 Tax=Anopheles farauti TaxID=69004 RepID=A0A182Q4M4_9DIPT